MPTVTSVPGVYIEEDATPAMSVSPGATAIPLFIGRFNPLKPELAGVITRVSSWLDYSTQFDTSISSSASVTITSTLVENAPESLDSSTDSDKSVKRRAKGVMREEEKGYIYEIEEIEISESIASIALQLYFQNGGGPCYLYPLEKADDAKQLAALPELIDEVGEITLLASPESNETYRNTVYGALASSLSQFKGYFLLADSSGGQAPSGVSGSAHVAVYYPDIVVPYVREIDDADVTIEGYVDGNEKAITTLAELRASNAVLAKSIDEYLDKKAATPLLIPPSSLMAGVYCKTDRERGVWKAPANVVINGLSDISVRVTDEQQGEMNLAGINVIRHFSDRGFVVWGGRTQQDDDDWRYISVRRLFDAAERDIKKALRPMLFEPNSQPTWKRVQTAIDNYLYSLWQQGGLAGNKVEEAYFVHVGKGITMTQDDINQGKMIIHIGMAAVRPAEFIILKFTQDMSQ